LNDSVIFFVIASFTGCNELTENLITFPSIDLKWLSVMINNNKKTLMSKLVF